METEMQELIEAAERAQILLRGLTIRNVFDRGIEAINAAGLNPWAINEGRADGTERVSTDWLDNAIAAARAYEGESLEKILGVGQKFPDAQQRAIDLVNQMKELGEHKGKENSGIMYCLDVIVNLLRASEGGWIEPGSCKNCGHSEHGKCMAWAGNGLGWCKCENYEPAPPLSVEKPEVQK